MENKDYDFEREYFLEAYFNNKPKNLYAAEKALDELVSIAKEVFKNDGGTKTTDKKYNAAFKTVIDSLFKQFNFNPNFSFFEVSSSVDFIRVRYGFPRYVEYSGKEFVTIDTKAGVFRFKEEYAPALEVFISPYFLGHPRMTGEILLASILHEMGHLVERQFRCILYKDKATEYLYQFFKRFGLLSIERRRAELLTDSFRGLIEFFTPDNERKETFADQFAGMFGYGPACVEALKITEDVIDKYQRKRVKGKVVEKTDLGFFMRGVYELSQCVAKWSRTHPDFGERASDMIAYLEYELKHNKDIKPSDRKKIQEDIDKIKATVAKRAKYDKDDSEYSRRVKDIDAESFKTKQNNRSDDDNEVRGIDLYMKKFGLK